MKLSLFLCTNQQGDSISEILYPITKETDSTYLQIMDLNVGSILFEGCILIFGSTPTQSDY
jgi:hypothetical protein